MPGPYIHLSTVRHITHILTDVNKVARLKESLKVEGVEAGPSPTDIGLLLQAYPNFSSLGAIGPDLFFFLPDFRNENGVKVSSVLIGVLDFLEEVQSKLDPFISKYEHYLGPLDENTAEEMSRLTGGMSEIVGDITGELANILTTALLDLGTQSLDVFKFFSLGLNRGWDEQAFLWSDMLHYRETGKFARALWESSQTREGQDEISQCSAYVLGYMSHLGCDVTGHPFVNSIAGGPFRLHWQRHHLVENHMDADWYLKDTTGVRTDTQYPQLTESALYWDIAFNDDGSPKTRPPYPSGGTLRENYERRRKLDTDSELPDAVAELLIEAMTKVFYQDGKHPRILVTDDGKPNVELIKQAYDLLYDFLKLNTLSGFSHEPPDPPDWFPNLDFPSPTDPSDAPPGNDDNDSFWGHLLDVILSIIAVIEYLVQVAVYLATLPWAILADVVTYPFRLAAYYCLELPLYHILTAFRMVLVMTGYQVPMKEEIAYSITHVGITTKDGFKGLLTDIEDVFGGVKQSQMPPETTRFVDPNYPYLPDPYEFHHPWDYPSTLVENSPTTAGPYGKGAGPEALFASDGTNSDLIALFRNAATPVDADVLGQRLAPDIHMGSPIGFSLDLIWRYTRTEPNAITDWNLDGDRGYGYHCWDWNRDSSNNAKDPEGHDFNLPCTPPPQESGYQQQSPLLLHWTDVSDPGCGSVFGIIPKREKKAGPRAHFSRRRKQ